MSTMQTIEEYVNNLVETLTKITMTNFFKEVHSKYYNDQDISFMEYFLDLINHNKEFYVHHSKLVEYGVMTSTESSKVKDKLNQFDLIKDEDYTLADIRERGKSGAQIHKHYYLTPKAFKICLMRSRKYKDQPVDPRVYCIYYLLLEEVYKYYTDYERLYSKKLLSIKDDKIDELIRENKEQSKKLDEQSKKMDEQAIRINKLLDGTDFIKNQNKNLMEEVREVNTKLDKMSYYLQNVFQVIDNNQISVFQTKCLILYKIIYKDSSIKYFLSSRQLMDIIKTCKEKQKNPNIQSITYLRVFEPTNDASILKLIKNRLKKHKNISINYNTIDASCIQEELLIQTIESILNESKYNVFEALGVEYNQNHMDAYTFIYKKIVERAFDRYFRLNEDINQRVMKDIYSSLKNEIPKEE